MKRLVVVQVLMFLVIAAVVIPFGVRFVAGPAGLSTPMTLRASMTDAFGLNSDQARLIRLFFQPVLVAAALYAGGPQRDR